MSIPVPPPLPRLSGNVENHSHCLNCVNIGQCLQPTNSCPVVLCGLHCGSRYHKCKEEEHKELCPYVLVPCINILNGCTMSMLRRHKSQHLATCGVMKRSAKEVNIPIPPPLPISRSSSPKQPPMSRNRSDDGLHRHCSGCVLFGQCFNRSCPVVSCSLNCGSRYHRCKEEEHKDLCPNNGPHRHCALCIKTVECHQSPKICPVVSCLLECGARYHICKEDEHRELCPNLRVRCWFLSDGCQKTMLRSERTNHVAVCEVINRSNKSYPQPFPTKRSNMPKPPPLPPMGRSGIPIPPPLPMITSNTRRPPILSKNKSNIPPPPPPPTNRAKPPTEQLSTSTIPKPPPIPGNRSDGPHRHCLNCFNPDKCPQLKSCLIVFCGLKCGSRYHICKKEEHQELCPNVIVPCTNLNNGCQKTVLRGERSKHLKYECEVIKALAPLPSPSVKPSIPKPPPKVYGKMVMGKFVSIPPPAPPPGLLHRGQAIIARPTPALVNGSNIPMPPPLPVNRSNSQQTTLPTNRSNLVQPAVLPPNGTNIPSSPSLRSYIPSFSWFL